MNADSDSVVLLEPELRRPRLTPLSLLSGQTLGGYRIDEELGRGTTGVVFKAHQLSIDRVVALKFLPAGAAEDAHTVARFELEARAAGRFSHPHIVHVHDVGVLEGYHFIAMEYIDGISVQRLLDEHGPLSEAETLLVAEQVAEALKVTHDRGVLHRDIKPDNFLIDGRKHVWLSDLGFAHLDDTASFLQDGMTLGTPHFMSPEQCTGAGVDARSDLYSLGVSMFVMATCHTPFEGVVAEDVLMKVLTVKPRELQALRPELSPEFVALIQKMMAKRPADRFADARDALEAIRQCKAPSSMLATAIIRPPPREPPKRFAERLHAMLLGTGMAAGLLIVVFLLKPKPAPHTPARAEAQAVAKAVPASVSVPRP